MIKLAPRSPTSYDKMVVLWIVATRDVFLSVKEILTSEVGTESTPYRCDSPNLHAYDCQVCADFKKNYSCPL